MTLGNKYTNINYRDYENMFLWCRRCRWILRYFDYANLPICDIVVLSVKSYDLENAVKDINRITNKDSKILPLLRGVDIYDRIRKFLEPAIVIPSCVYIGTHIESPATHGHKTLGADGYPSLGTLIQDRCTLILM